MRLTLAHVILDFDPKYVLNEKGQKILSDLGLGKSYEQPIGSLPVETE